MFLSILGPERRRHGSPRHGCRVPLLRLGHYLQLPALGHLHGAAGDGVRRRLIRPARRAGEG